MRSHTPLLALGLLSLCMISQATDIDNDRVDIRSYASDRSNAASTRNRRTTSAGGYFPADIRDPVIAEAVDFVGEELIRSPLHRYAISDGAPLQLSLLEASKQVVAGINYKLTVAVSAGDTCLGGFKVDIWDHFGEMSITKWGEELSCEELAVLREN